MIRIVVGSKSVIKIEAVKAAVAILCLNAEVLDMEASSGVHPQPYGTKETLQGALNRALQAHGHHPGSYAIGIENGLEPEGETSYCDFAYVSILTPRSHFLTVRSGSVPVPYDLVRATMSRYGQDVTVGSIEAKLSGCPADDPHRVWSGGKTDRKTILIGALTRALTFALRIEGATS